MFVAIATQLAFMLTLSAQARPDRTVTARRTVIEFSEVEINGRIVGPETTLIQSRGRTRFLPLLRVRKDFLPELVRSVERL